MLHSDELHLVLKAFLELLPTQNVLCEVSASEDKDHYRTHLDLPQLAILPFDGTVHHLLILIRQNPSRFFHHLPVMTILVPPLTRGCKHLICLLVIHSHVLHSGLSKVLIDVVEGVLRDIADTQCRVLAD